MSFLPFAVVGAETDHFSLHSLQSLYDTAAKKAANNGGEPPKVLDDNKAPLKPVTYAKKAAPKSWRDCTAVDNGY